MLVIDHLPGRDGPVTVVTVAPGCPPVAVECRSLADALAAIISDHEAVQWLDVPVVDLWLAPQAQA